MDEFFIKRDMNVVFLGGQVVSTPEFKFFYNSKKFISKISFVLQTEMGFCYSIKNKPQQIKIVAYNENADIIYQKFELNSKIQLRGYLENGEVVCEEIY